MSPGPFDFPSDALKELAAELARRVSAPFETSSAAIWQLTHALEDFDDERDARIVTEVLREWAAAHLWQELPAAPAPAEVIAWWTLSEVYWIVWRTKLRQQNSLVWWTEVPDDFTPAPNFAGDRKILRSLPDGFIAIDQRGLYLPIGGEFTSLRLFAAGTAPV